MYLSACSFRIGLRSWKFHDIESCGLPVIFHVYYWFQTSMKSVDQIDLLREQKKILSGEVALHSSALKRLSEEAAKNPRKEQIHVSLASFIFGTLVLLSLSKVQGKWRGKKMRNVRDISSLAHLQKNLRKFYDLFHFLVLSHNKCRLTILGPCKFSI